MNISETWLLRGLVVLLTLCALSIGILLSKEKVVTHQTLTKQIEKLKTERDSLEKALIIYQGNLYETENELGRYQYTLDFMRDANPAAANQFEEYMQTKTE